MNQLRIVGKFAKLQDVERRKRSIEHLEKAREAKVRKIHQEEFVESTNPKCEVHGYRLIKIAEISKLMKCDSCATILFFDFVQSEKRYGLASVFAIKCHNCLCIKEVHTSSRTAVEKGRSLYEINAAVAFGCIDSGVGHEQLTTLLTAMDVQPITHQVLKKCEEQFGEAFIRVADRSCWNAIIEEKAFNLADKCPSTQINSTSKRNPRFQQRKTILMLKKFRNKL
ncbi:uncharacterized protein [Temnothorax longispinosus]|uniref:uncharacterized protein isoform X2 n=1 Tax=Temnothorax longispinosus TaxID=300112 RepID=UPI003A99CC52